MMQSTIFKDIAPVSKPSTSNAIRHVLDRQGSRLKTGWLFTGPAVIASIAYVDPGNFATNIQAGAKYGYQLLWVVLLSNLIAMLFQALSAKLGIVTGKNLAELSRDRFPRPVSIMMWVVSELAAMATDLAEFLGASIGISLLCGLSLLTSMSITAVITYTILVLVGNSFRKTEMIIGGFVVIIALCYVVELFLAPIDWQATAAGFIMPSVPDHEAILIATGILGATVMPHAIYLHSALTQQRAPILDDDDREKVLRYSNREVCIALGLAGIVNAAMVMMAAAAFNMGHSDVAEIETAYHTLTPLLGGAAAAIFLTSLLASGLSSSVVGTMGGQVIFQGFFNRHIPLWLRRLVTMIPAFIVAAWGVSATKALIISQVILSIALPVPVIALIILTGQRDIMGRFVNTKFIHALAVFCAIFVLTLNGVLIYTALT